MMKIEQEIDFPLVGVYTSTAAFDCLSVPQSFIDGMNDYYAGRVVDMDTALNDPPQ